LNKIKIWLPKFLNVYLIKMKHAIIKNIPKNPRELYDAALSKSYKSWVDEKGTVDNPGVFQRKPSKLTYEEAFPIIQENSPHWVISFRQNTYFSQIDYWEFGGCNIGTHPYGEVFIWIKVLPADAEEIFEKFNLNINWY